MSLILSSGTAEQPPEDDDVAAIVVAILRERFGSVAAAEIAQDQRNACEDDSRDAWDRVSSMFSGAAPREV